MATAPSNISTRKANPCDRSQILDLMRSSLGEGDIPRTDAFWRWKHEENPFGPSPVLVAEADGRIVGLRTFLRWRWCCGDRFIKAVRAVDTATHPDYWGKGIFKRLTLELVDQMSAEGVAFVFNTPNDKSRPGYLKMGWSSLGRVPIWARPRRPIRMLRGLLSRRTAEYRISNDSRVVPIAGLFDEPGLEEVISHSIGRNTRRLTTCTTVEYLQWRYGPPSDFHYFSIWDLDRPGGVVVIFRLRNRGGLRELRICQLIMGTRSGNAKRVSGIISQAGRIVDADYIAATAPSTTEARHAMIRAGFMPAPRLGPIVTVLPIQEDATLDFMDSSSWQFSVGDLELF